MSRMTLARVHPVLCAFALVGVVGGVAAVVGEEMPRSEGAAILELRLPAALGELERPAVWFDHGVHTTALEAEGCQACHGLDERGRLIPGLQLEVDREDRDALMDGYHDSCVGCHRQRATTGSSHGPVTCGECHARGPERVSSRVPLRFDYSLHGRHGAAYPEKCDPCHHVLDEKLQQLTYVKGKEDSCRACHGASDEESKPSLRNAVHRACVSCHRSRAEQGASAGPVLCVGCHDLERQRAYARLEEIPRLLRGQSDVGWIGSREATARAVAFTHLQHEGQARSCSTCHHQSLQACVTCHTVTGASEGGGVTLERAQHLVTSAHSCVGCHVEQAREGECVGCHAARPRSASERSCAICHSGPLASTIAEDSAPPVVETVELGPLPATSDDFPETVRIEGLVDRYEASTLPHRKIVERLHAAIQKSALARRFHASTETLCAGCHHHSPIGSRPPACGSCHGHTGHATLDKPGLKAAYHRQCMGCHQKMALGKEGCTDCHAAREVEP